MPAPTARNAFDARLASAAHLKDARRRLHLSYDLEKDTASARPLTPDFDAAAKAAVVADLIARQNISEESLLMAEIVQLFSAWEAFLRDGFAETLVSSPAHLQRTLNLSAPPSCKPETGDTVIALANLTFEGKAAEHFKAYLAVDSIWSPATEQGLRRLTLLRHATVHGAGRVPLSKKYAYQTEFGNLDPVWVVAERDDQAGTTRLLGAKGPLLKILDVCRESVARAVADLDAKI